MLRKRFNRYFLCFLCIVVVLFSAIGCSHTDKISDTGQEQNNVEESQTSTEINDAEDVKDTENVDDVDDQK